MRTGLLAPLPWTSGSRTVRYTFLLLESHPDCGFLLQKPRRLRLSVRQPAQPLRVPKLLPHRLGACPVACPIQPAPTSAPPIFYFLSFKLPPPKAPHLLEKPYQSPNPTCVPRGCDSQGSLPASLHCVNGGGWWALGDKVEGRYDVGEDGRGDLLSELQTVYLLFQVPSRNLDSVHASGSISGFENPCLA